jgi:hypothetical protein
MSRRIGSEIYLRRGSEAAPPPAFSHMTDAIIEAGLPNRSTESGGQWRLWLEDTREPWDYPGYLKGPTEKTAATGVSICATST